MSKDSYSDNRRARRDSPTNTPEEEAAFDDAINDMGYFARLLELIGDRKAFIVISILVIALAAFFYHNSTDLLTAVRESLSADGAAGPTDEPPVDAPSVAELEAQEPIDITDGPWSFSREGQSYVLYTMDFESDGTFDVPDDSGFVQDGTYIVDGDSVEIELRRQKTYEAEGPQNDKRTEDVEWYEWFHMTRVGNTMRGSWEGTDWEFSY
ncbi:MAG: hypothetical protein PF636_00120, partial [Actinomycetota bacterium]|nr:hypothetical protein [Actinomycetota bacterium]